MCCSFDHCLLWWIIFGMLLYNITFDLYFHILTFKKRHVFFHHSEASNRFSSERKFTVNWADTYCSAWWSLRKTEQLVYWELSKIVPQIKPRCRYVVWLWDNSSDITTRWRRYTIDYCVSITPHITPMSVISMINHRNCTHRKATQTAGCLLCCKTTNRWQHTLKWHTGKVRTWKPISVQFQIPKAKWKVNGGL